jgi:glycerol-1-phosphate dehydrogenase [NAD(P)+]
MSKVESALQRTTDTKALVIGADALERSAAMFKSLFPGKRAIIVADKITYPLAGEAVKGYFEAAGIAQDAPHIFGYDDSFAEWTYIAELEQVLNQTDAIPVAVGSGVVNDLTKLSSYRCGRRYMCVGTAASMDGYTAYGASITYQGNKQTFDCPAPYGMALDPRIAAGAPKAMSASGYADLIAKIPAGADWMIADAVGSEAIDTFAFDVVQDGLQEALCDPEGVYNGDVHKVEQLAEGLLLSGFAMQAAKSSRPASGMEHQFSHFWDMENLEYEGKHVSHGFKVGIGTLASTASIELLLEAPIESLDIDACVARWKSWEQTEQDILRIFAGKQGFIDRALTETKNKYVDGAGLRCQLEAFKAAWPELKGRIRNQIIPFEEVRRRLKAVGAPYEPEQLGISRARFRDTYAKIPYMRSRFSNIDIAYRCGYMDQWIERLFGKGGIWEVR